MSTPEDIPAVLGGTPLFPKGPPEWPGCLPEVRDALVEAWADGSWGRYDGPLVETLQQTISEWLGRKHALGVASGTMGLELALKALGVGNASGNRAETRPENQMGVALCDYDYPGNFLTIHHLGAVPILVDTDPQTGQMCSHSLDNALGQSKIPVKAVVVSILHGSSPDLRAIAAVCEKKGVPWIEDACQVVGGAFDGNRHGSHGAISIWSFGGSKLLSAGRGGMVFTNDPVLAQRMRLANTRGSIVAGLSELQAAAVLAQWPHLGNRHAQRAREAEILRSGLGHVPGIRVPKPMAESKESAYYKFDFFLDAPAERFEWALSALKNEGLAIDRGFRSLSLGRSASRFHAPVGLQTSHTNSPQRVVLHHPVLLEEGAGEKISRAIRRVMKRI